MVDYLLQSPGPGGVTVVQQDGQPATLPAIAAPSGIAGGYPLAPFFVNVVPPSSSDLTFWNDGLLNQSEAVFTDAPDVAPNQYGVVLADPIDDAETIQGPYFSLPASGPWTVTAGLTVGTDNSGAGGPSYVGLFFWNPANDPDESMVLVTCELEDAINAYGLGLGTASDAGTADITPLATKLMEEGFGPLLVRVSYDGTTNLTVSFSGDGVNWFTGVTAGANVIPVSNIGGAPTSAGLYAYTGATTNGSMVSELCWSLEVTTP